MTLLRPPRLRAGTRVALVSPAGPSPAERIAQALERCGRFGLEPVPGASAAARDGYLAGPDDARLGDLQNAIDDPSIDAIWAIRGGYGSMRILSRLDLSPLRSRPKAFIGFSDNTALHLAFERAGMVSFHGPHAGAAWPPMAEACFRSVLFDAAPAGALPSVPGEPPFEGWRGGVAEGTLIGGNLALLAGLCGTPWAPRLQGRILLVEDVGEAVYRIDRMLTQLTLAGAMDGVAGIVVGRFNELPEEEDEAALTALLRGWATSFGVPVLAGVPSGHADENWTVPFGVRARLDADAGVLELLEAAVT